MSRCPDDMRLAYLTLRYRDAQTEIVRRRAETSPFPPVYWLPLIAGIYYGAVFQQKAEQCGS
jgi:hypothetical protein